MYRYFVDMTNNQFILSKGDYPQQNGWASSNQLKSLKSKTGVSLKKKLYLHKLIH